MKQMTKFKHLSPFNIFGSNFNIDDFFDHSFDNVFNQDVKKTVRTVRDNDSTITHDSSDGKERRLEFPLAGFEKEHISAYYVDSDVQGKRTIAILAKKKDAENYNSEERKLSYTYTYDCDKYELKESKFESGMLYVYLSLKNIDADIDKPKYHKIDIN